MKLCAVVLLVFLYTVNCSTNNCPPGEDNFIVEPEPQTVAIGSQAEFNCTVLGHIGSPLFTFDGQLINAEKAEEMNGSLTNVNWSDCSKTVIFRLPGFVEYNNTEVVCTILLHSGDGTVSSDTALLRVHGPPEQVSELAIHHQGGNTHSFTWTAPFSLQGVQILYNLLVIDRNNETWSRIDTTLTDTAYNITLMPCQTYTFTLTPFNDAGYGAHSELEYFFPGAPVSPAVHNISISDLALNRGNGLVIATVEYPVTSTCYTNQNITIEAHTLDGPFVSASQVVDDAVTVVFDGIPLNKVLYVNLVLSNQFGSSPVLGDIIIKTYNIQSVSLTKNNRNGTTCFKCVFLSNSQTRGCFLNLVPLTTSKCGYTRNVTFTKDENCSSSDDVCIDGLYSGAYNIEVYDLYNNSTVLNADPQVVTNIDIAGLECLDPFVPPVNSESSYNRPLSMATSSVRQTPIVTGEAVEENSNFDTMRTAGILIGGVCGVLIIVVIVILTVYIYRRRQIKQGALRINESSHTVPENVVTTIQNDEAASIPPSFSSLSGPPPYQPPPAHENYDQYPTEQYIIMHSASPRSPTASNSHLALIQGSCASSSSCSSVHKDFSTSGHYDHLIQTDDQESSKKYPFDNNLSQPRSLKPHNDQYSFELRPFHRNEHLV